MSGPPVPTNPFPFRTIGDKRGLGILRRERVLNMCKHGADRGSYCGYCGGYSVGDGATKGVPSNVGL